MHSRINNAIRLLLLLGMACALMAPFRATAAMPVDAATFVQAAQHDFSLGNYLGAIKSLQTAVSQSTTNPEVYYWLARSYYELRDYDNSITNAEKAVSLDAKNSLYHQWLGRAYGGKADRDRSFFLAKKVKKELAEAVRLNPSNIEARMDIEDFCINAPWIVGGNKDEAHDQVDAIAALDAMDGHVARAKYEMEAMKRPDAADSEYRMVLASKSNRIGPYLEAAAFFEKQNKLADMESAVQEAERVNAKDPRVDYFQATQWILSDTEAAHAEEYLKSYLASTPERSDWPSHAAAREWLGRLYESQGKPAEAAEQYRVALQLEPGRKEATTRLQKLEKASQ